MTGVSNLHCGLSEVSQWQQPSQCFFALFWWLTVWEHRRPFGEALKLRLCMCVSEFYLRVWSQTRNAAQLRGAASKLTFPADTLGAFGGAVVLLPVAVFNLSDDQNTLTLEPGSRLQLPHSIKAVGKKTTSKLSPRKDKNKTYYITVQNMSAGSVFIPSKTDWTVIIRPICDVYFIYSVWICFGLN